MKKEFFTRTFLALFLVGSIASCSLKDRKSAFGITVQMPVASERVVKHARFFSPPTSVSDFQCFALNITAPDISATAKQFSCSNQSIGLVAGMAPISGGVVSAMVPAGAGRTIQLIGVQSSGDCSSFGDFLNSLDSANPGGAMLAAGFGNPVVLGSATVDVFSDTSVNIQASLGPDQSLFNGCGLVAMAPPGIIKTIAGDGTSGDTYGVATSAKLDNPNGVAADLMGNIFISDTSNNQIKMIPARDGMYYGSTSTMLAGNIYRIAGDAAGTAYYSGDGAIATSAELYGPTGLVVDTFSGTGNGNLFIADTLNSAIRMIPAQSGTYYGISMTAGYIYTVVGRSDASCTTWSVNLVGTTGQLCYPFGLAVDSYHNLYFSDYAFHVIGMLSAGGPEPFNPAAVSGGISGKIYGISGIGGSHGSDGDGPAISKRLYAPKSLALDVSGNLFVADSNNNAIKKISVSDASISTLATVIHPIGMIVDAIGNVIVGDSGSKIHLMFSSPGTYYGIDYSTATPGGVYTLAGTGTDSYFGDNILASTADLNSATGFAFGPAGDLIFVDTGNNVVRVIGH